MTTRARHRDVVVAALAGAGILAVLLVARWTGAEDAREARDRAIADSAAAAAVHRVAVVRRGAQAAGRVYVGTVAPHVESRAATDRAIARAVDEARAAERERMATERVLADTAATLPALRLALRRSADQIGVLTVQVAALVDTVAIERARAADRIAAAEARSDSLKALVAAQDAREAARVAQLAVASRRVPWWRRAVGGICSVGLTGAGGGTGAVVGGPTGAAVGAVVGYAGGRLGCRH